MESVTHFITYRLKLTVNQAKTVARPQERQFLGFSFTGGSGALRPRPCSG